MGNERVHVNQKRIIIGISGASGVIYGIRLLKVLQGLDMETHLIISEAAKKTIFIETSFTVKNVEEMANEVYQPGDLAAPISSGSFRTEGMIY